jgi:hypothetical protein
MLKRYKVEKLYSKRSNFQPFTINLQKLCHFEPAERACVGVQVRNLIKADKDEHGGNQHGVEGFSSPFPTVLAGSSK